MKGFAVPVACAIRGVLAAHTVLVALDLDAVFVLLALLSVLDV